MMHICIHILKSYFFVLLAVRSYLIIIYDIMCRNAIRLLVKSDTKRCFSTILDYTTSNVNMTIYMLNVVLGVVTMVLVFEILLDDIYF